MEPVNRGSVRPGNRPAGWWRFRHTPGTGETGTGAGPAIFDVDTSFPRGI